MGQKQTNTIFCIVKMWSSTKIPSSINWLKSCQCHSRGFWGDLLYPTKLNLMFIKNKQKLCCLWFSLYALSSSSSSLGLSSISMCVNVWWNSLEDSVVNQQLCGQRSQQGDADSEAEAAAGAVERPPQTDGERRQRQRQLDVVGKVHFLTDGGSRTRQSTAVFTELLHVYHFTFNPVSLHQRS